VLKQLPVKLFVVQPIYWNDVLLDEMALEIYVFDGTSIPPPELLKANTLVSIDWRVPCMYSPIPLFK